jgi:hypothetical protein
MYSRGGEVLQMLCPQGGWILVGDSFEGITWVDDRPRCTKSEFEAGFAKVEAYKKEQEIAKTNAKATAESKLSALGLTTEDLRALGL